MNRLVVVPQAMRIITPLLTNQYLNLAKNSSLAVFIGYPDLVQVFAGTVLNQTGAAVQVIFITMAVYLTISLAHLVGDKSLQSPRCVWWRADMPGSTRLLGLATTPFMRTAGARSIATAAGCEAAAVFGLIRENLFDGWRASLLTISRGADCSRSAVGFAFPVF